MNQTVTFKVGDKIIHFGQVYKIFKIKTEKIKNQAKSVIFFKPYFKTPINKSLVCSLPLENIVKTNIRKPMSKKELNRLFKKLSKNINTDKPVNIKRAREKLTLNDPLITVRILRRLWQDKIDETINFSKSKQDVYRLAIKRIVQEIALVTDLSLDKAKEKIEVSLKKN
jgi:RNA polymerase-interacting CarD/CdnL/TRCF family regulator